MSQWYNINLCSKTSILLSYEGNLYAHRSDTEIAEGRQLGDCIIECLYKHFGLSDVLEVYQLLDWQSDWLLTWHFSPYQ